jgi:CubicO group peptidase (beta-lactamase class C family)
MQRLALPRLLTLLALLLILAGLAGCSDDDDGGTAPTVQTLDELLTAADFQGVVLVRRGDQDLLRTAYGAADVASGAPNTLQTRFRIGSVTKSFTAMAVVHLRREGLLTGYDQTIDTIVPDYPRGDEITIRHLLTHRSGLPDYLGYVDDTQPHEPEDLIDAIIDEPLAFDPGTAFQYSNTNYAALGIIIQILTDMSYADYLSSRVLAPLGLTETNMGTDPITAPGDARGHHGQEYAAPTAMSVAWAAGALVSDLDDLERWADALLVGSLMDEVDRAAIFPPMFDQPGYNVPGMGWFVLNDGGRTVWHHGGDINGFTALVAMVPDVDGMLIMLSNRQDEGELRNQLLERVLAEELR